MATSMLPPNGNRRSEFYYITFPLPPSICFGGFLRFQGRVRGNAMKTKIYIGGLTVPSSVNLMLKVVSYTCLVVINLEAFSSTL